MKNIQLSVVVLAKNEEAVIADCLKSVKWADEVILVDNGSTDKTLEIVRKYPVRIISYPSNKPEFAKLRNLGLTAAKGEWLLYVDADERVTPELREEVRNLILNTQYSAFQIPRRNFYLGQEMHYGGAWPDYVKRLFLKKNLKRWERELHEDPIFAGEMGTLAGPLLHFTHRDLTSMVEKTIKWSKIEAQLLYETKHPPVTWWRILRMMLTEFWQRGLRLSGWRDGIVGWIEVIFQMFSRFITYARLWELQKKSGRS